MPSGDLARARPGMPLLAVVLVFVATVAAALEPFATAFAVLLDTGLREEELLHLTKADVDFAACRSASPNGWPGGSASASMTACGNAAQGGHPSSCMTARLMPTGTCISATR